ncbi:acyl-CoA dehydrogenase family protein [Cytobacillus gottheilii]|uniref:acyl-CoA dehydrogenase family protein n=1 Tax=Cytobacillus gottheilii TaxID=859144 RepID=UPI0009BA192A|nr:acyl-CoA dehydrogenase family protein [Cytobacillus gottheilii]
MNFLQIDHAKERLHALEKIAENFRKRADAHDTEGTFPFENISELKQSGYTALTVPKEYGGQGISLAELLHLQETIAERDGSTALSIGWHMGIVHNLFEKKEWDKHILQWIAKEVLNGALINTLATEKQTGSPTRGGNPHTTARKQNNEWIINGRKSFATMSPVLDYMIVTATITETEEVGSFIIPANKEGIIIEETWDSVAMKGTGSHDVIFKDVVIKNDHLVEIMQPCPKRANGWLLHIPACYLGIARAAQSYSIQFAKKYTPSSISKPIIELPNVRQKLGEIELELSKSRYFMYGVAKEWDEKKNEARDNMTPILSAVKHEATNSAIKIVDLAMRVAGAHSLSQSNPLQRYYRDVRAGLHNPPMDDMTIEQLAAFSIDKQK